MKTKEILEKMCACDEAIEWVDDMTIEEAWDKCERGDWMLWYYAKSYPENIKELTLVTGYCAQTVLHLMKDELSIKAVQASIDFGNGLVDEIYLRSAYDASAAASIAAFTAASASSGDRYDADAIDYVTVTPAYYASVSAAYAASAAHASAAAADPNYVSTAAVAAAAAASYAAAAHAASNANAPDYHANAPDYHANAPTTPVSAYNVAKKDNQLLTANMCRKYLHLI